MTDESTGVSADVRVVRLAGGDSDRWLGAALSVYTTAMDYPRGIEAQRRSLWREHTARAGWSAVGAVAADDVLVGIAYGYRGAPDQWWNQQLRLGLRQAGYPADYVAGLLADYFELTELHVHPAAQGRGVGQALLSTLLTGRPEARVLLSTPEVPDEGNRAWSLYRRLGFADVLRHFTFAGDPRPFAFLGRELPLRVSLDTAPQPIWHD